MHHPFHHYQAIETGKRNRQQAAALSSHKILLYVAVAALLCLFNAIISYLYLFPSYNNINSADPDKDKPPQIMPSPGYQMDLIVVAPTFYAKTDDVRYRLGVEACREAAKYEVSLLLVDASPSSDIKVGLERAGRTADGRSFVRVVAQTWQGAKGVALREGIHLAAEQLEGKDDAVIGFQELEKVSMFKHYQKLVGHIVASGSQIAVPRRNDATFKRTYPIEQYHSEKFANMLLDSIGSQIGMPSIDWTIGPVLFRSDQVQYWLDYNGETWDAQLVPIVDAHIKGSTVSSFEIDYEHPKEMKDQEQGQSIWNEKRLHQINVLVETVGKRMKEEADKQDN